MFKLRRFIIEYGSEKEFQAAPDTLHYDARREIKEIKSF